MKTRFALLILIFVVISISACKTKIDLHPLLSNLVKQGKDSIPLNLEQSVSFKDWDELYIVTPYSPMETIQKTGIKGYESIGGLTREIEYSENFCLLLFLKNKELVGFSKIQRKPVDFASVVGRIFISKEQSKHFKLIKTFDIFEPGYDVYLRQ